VSGRRFGEMVEQSFWRLIRRLRTVEWVLPLLAAGGLLCCALSLASAGFRPVVATQACAVTPTPSTALRAGADQWLFLWGVAFFALSLLLHLIPMLIPQVSSRNVQAYIFVLSLGPLVVVARALLAWVRAGSLPTIGAALAALCITGVFLRSATADIPPLKSLPTAFVRDIQVLARHRRGHAIAASLGIALVAFTIASIHRRMVERHTRQLATARLIEWFDSQVPLKAPSVVSERAGVLVVKFHDYQCPACKVAFERLDPVILDFQRRLPGRVSYRVMDYPLDNVCNDRVAKTLHSVACEAAAAVRLTHSEGKDTAPFEKWLFAHQSTLTESEIWGAAGRLSSTNVSSTKYAAALAAVQDSVREGADLEVSSTPTYFVNGVRISGVIPAYALEAILQHEVERSLDHEK